VLSIAGIGWGTHTVFEVRKTGQPISVRHSALSSVSPQSCTFWGPRPIGSYKDPLTSESARPTIRRKSGALLVFCFLRSLRGVALAGGLRAPIPLQTANRRDHMIASGGVASEGAGIVIILILIALYFVPTIVALIRSHHQTNSIVVINVFLGWTLVGYSSAIL
jgi:hypothetical protein